MAVPIETGAGWKAGTPEKVFDWPVPPFDARSYDVSADGRRFLLMKPVQGSDQPPPSTLVVVQHFDEELKRLVPTN
jgi:hypothetical protein